MHFVNIITSINFRFLKYLLKTKSFASVELKFKKNGKRFVWGLSLKVKNLKELIYHKYLEVFERSIIYFYFCLLIYEPKPYTVVKAYAVAKSYGAQDGAQVAKDY